MKKEITMEECFRCRYPMLSVDLELMSTGKYYCKLCLNAPYDPEHEQIIKHISYVGNSIIELIKLTI